jgi:hypothetical protein
MIERTHRRLRQARFFYQHLVDARHQPKGDPEAFRFYFFAFIETARTIPWALGNEEPDKWKEWEPKWKANLTKAEQKLLDITNKFRIAEVHRGGANLPVDFEEVVIDAFVETSPPDGKASPPEFNIKWYERRQQTVNRLVHYFQDKEDKEDREEISALCLRYLNFLEKMVKDFREDNQVE